MVTESALRALDSLRIKDDHLRRVLEGRAFLVEDGGMGTLLQQRGLTAGGEAPDLLCLSNPDDITAAHASYVDAGADLVTTNTFGSNALKLGDAASVADVYAAGAACARAAHARYVAGDIGPCGEILDPYGDLEEEDAYDLFFEQAQAAEAAGVDLIIVETMTDLNEARIAVSAARAASKTPIFATMAFAENGRTVFGASPEDAARELFEAGANAVGANCSVGPDALLGIVERFAASSPCPVIAKPNAGLPHVIDGETRYDVAPEDFVEAMGAIIEAGATIVGGCCGTDPRFIERLSELVRSKEREQEVTGA